MFKRRRHVVPGEAPGLLKLSQDSPQETPAITLIEYGPDCLEEQKDADCDELLKHLNNDLVTWINIDGLGDLSVLRILGERFNLHPSPLKTYSTPVNAQKLNSMMTISLFSPK